MSPKTAARPWITGTALCWGSVPQADLMQLVDLAARHGFPEVSVRPSQFTQSSVDRERLVAQCRRLGVAVGVIDALMTHLPGSAGPDRAPTSWRRHMVGLEECLEAAVGLGARTLNIAHYLGDPSADRGAMAAAVHEVADRCATHGIGVSVEFIPGTGIPDLGAAADIVRRTDHPSVGILFDVWHFLRSGGTPGEVAALASGEIVEAQISDRVPPPPGEAYVPMTGRLAPGEGTAPLAELVREVRRNAPDAVLGVEVFTADAGDPDTTTAQLAAATRRLLSTVGS